MMGFSTFIGLYYGFFAKRKQNNTNEYLLGSKSLKIIPVAISLTAG
jgi:Na+/proline symporter